MSMNNIYLCAHLAHFSLQVYLHTLAQKFTYGRCDMHMLSILIYDYCIISLFAETMLHVGQVPMLVIYIY